MDADFLCMQTDQTVRIIFNPWRNVVFDVTRHVTIINDKSQRRQN